MTATTMTAAQEAKLHDVAAQLVWKWEQPAGVELIREGAKITAHLINHGPLPVELADSWLPTPEDRARGMVRYFAERDYDLEVNAAGDIVGAGISLIADDRSKRHISTINDRRFYNWCVCDIVMFPMVLNVRSEVSTVDPSTGEKVSWTVTENAFENVSHPDVWFTLAPAHGGEIRQVYCDRVNIYADRAGAEAAAGADPQIAAAPLQELFNDTRKLADMF
ncbi:organomercurial lyase [Nocardia sp. NPDC004722]